jgi:hypothetical protein
MVGLVMVWCYPAWSDLVGLVCLLPLLVLDVLTMAFTSRPGFGGMMGTLLEPRADPACWPPLRLECRARVSGWWRAYLVHRRQTVPTLLAIGTAISLGAVWNAVPIPLAAGLATTGEINTLTWLLAGQVGALAVVMWLLKRSRGLVGAPDRLVPLSRRTFSWRLAWLCLAGVSCSLVLLGLPFLQNPWWLALSLFISTLAAIAWGVLLPRLRPSITAEVEASRHLAFGGGRLMSGPLAYEQALENQIRLVLRTGEGVLTAVCTPIVGFLIDSLTVERTLIFMGVVLAWFLGIVMVTNPAEMTDQPFAQPVKHTTWHPYDLSTREVHMQRTSRQKKPQRRP